MCQTAVAGEWPGKRTTAAGFQGSRDDTVLSGIGIECSIPDGTDVRRPTGAYDRLEAHKVRPRSCVDQAGAEASYGNARCTGLQVREPPHDYFRKRRCQAIVSMEERQRSRVRILWPPGPCSRSRVRARVAPSSIPASRWLNQRRRHLTRDAWLIVRGARIEETEQGALPEADNALAPCGVRSNDGKSRSAPVGCVTTHQRGLQRPHRGVSAVVGPVAGVSSSSKGPCVMLNAE